MLAIRLARVGKRNRAQFHVVLQEHTIAPGGRHIEILGSYDPHSKNATLKEEKIKYWLGQGAQPSDTAFNLLLSKGLVSGEKRKVKIPAKKVEEVKAEEAKKEESPKEEAKTEVVAKEEVKTEEVKVEEPKVEEKPAEVITEKPAVEEKKEEIKVEEAPVEEKKAE